MDCKKSVLVIGAGQIGAFFDKPNSKDILTHAHAFCKNPNFSLAGFIDKDMEKAQQAKQIWGGNVYKSIGEAFSKQKIDVVCVAVPDEFHYDVLKDIAEYLPQFVVAEKPLTKTIEQAREILHIYETKNIPMIVNYSRRFVPEFEMIKKNIQENIYGEYLTGTGYYGKGVLHNGSHLLDLLRYFFGEINVKEKVSSINDQYLDDPSVSAVLSFNNDRNFYLQYLDCRAYSLFEMDLCFEKKRIRIVNSGFDIEEYGVAESEMFKGYKNLFEAKRIKTGLSNALSVLTDNIFNCLVGDDIVRCSGKDGLNVLEICEALRG